MNGTSPGCSTYGDRVLHVSHGGGKLLEVKFRRVDQREGEIAGRTASDAGKVLPGLAVRQVGCVKPARTIAMRETNLPFVHTRSRVACDRKKVPNSG